MNTLTLALGIIITLLIALVLNSEHRIHTLKELILFMDGTYVLQGDHIANLKLQRDNMQHSIDAFLAERDTLQEHINNLKIDNEDYENANELYGKRIKELKGKNAHLILFFSLVDRGEMVPAELHDTIRDFE